MKNDNDIAIVGMSCFFPKASNLSEFWNNLTAGVDAIVEAPNERIESHYFSADKSNENDRFYCKKGGFVSPLKIDPIEYGILPIAAEGIDPEHLVALYLVKEALTDAGVFEKNIPLQKCCFVLGKGNNTGIAAFRVAEYIYQASQLEIISRSMFPDEPNEEIEKIKKDYQLRLGRYQADTAFGTMSNLIASLAANKFNLKGPAYTIDAACASSLIAVEHAVNMLLSGQCDIALTGGIQLGQGAAFWSIFNIIKAASFKGQISPFSEDADGLLIGEGAGVVVLKKLDKAIADNDRIYAVIKACASGSDGSDVSIMAPSSKGQVIVLKDAWNKSGLDPNKIGYVETHGTATQVGDRSEINTLLDFFGDNTAPPALLGSVKSNIGHAMSAAGIAGLIKAALALYYKKIPPTLHCENPMKAMFKSRFLPVQQLTDWDEEKYPLVAGVNAFGFGGINAHIVLEAYSNPNQPAAALTSKAELLKDTVISLSARTKEELLAKLDKKDYTVSEGNYRLVVFNPTEDKMNKAKILVEKDKPWKGRLDIWFSNDPLLADGGKVIFMFPGFDDGTEIETQTIVDYFDVPYKQVPPGKDPLMGHSINHYYRSKLLDQSLKKMGLIPDIYIGHSLGEWHAAEGAGCVTAESIEKLISNYNPEQFLLFDIYYLVVGCGWNRVKTWCEEITGVYLANDNCPNQIIVVGKIEEINLLIKRLKEEQIYHQILPYQSGYHSPLFPEAELKHLYDLYKEVLVYQERSVPLWSSTILAEYPKDKDDFCELFDRNLKETVRFRELVETLYDKEKARVFIQIGIGALPGFVEDTLRGKTVSIISAIHPTHRGIEQIRRVAALLFIEGKIVNEKMIGIVKANAGSKLKNTSLTLDFRLKMVNEYPLLREMILRYINEKKESSFLFYENDTEDAVLQEANNNLREIIALQEYIIKSYQSSEAKQRVVQKAPDAVNLQQAKADIEKTFRFDLNDHPYLVDHSVVRQPANRAVEELNPVVPFALTVESLCEITRESVPDKKVIRVNSVSVQKWIQVKTPFIEKITGHWKTDDCISWSLPSYAHGDITVGDDYPIVPDEYTKAIDLGDCFIPAVPNKNAIYLNFLFHGPQYQSIIEVTHLSKYGLRAYVQKTKGKGSLLDTIGQLGGLFCYIVMEQRQTTFPMNVKEIIFYEDFRDQEGVFECIMQMVDVKETEAICDVILKRGGKVWAVVKGWQNLRLNYHRKGMNTVIRPQMYYMSERLNKNVFFYYYESNINATFLEFLQDRYLNMEERAHYHSLYLNQARNFLISRIALKDAARKFIQKDVDDELIYPIEISIGHDEKGKPFIFGREELKGIEVSLAHKGSESVAMVSDEPVGIDIEKIEDHNEEFLDVAFTPHELDLLKNKENEAEWITRFWVAKEAYGKMLGLGLQGNPKQYEISSVTGNELIINNTIITTARHRNNYIIGWTQA